LFETTSPHHYIDTNAWRIHNYPLGNGTFGVVNLATHKSGGVQAAIKTIDSRSAGSDKWRERVSDEVGSMRKLNHPNVMKVLDKVKDTGAKLCKEDEDEEDENNKVWDWERDGIWKAHIVFELATGGDLFSYLESQWGLSEDETMFMSWQLVLGLDHLHANEVAHRGESILYPCSSPSSILLPS
jgi:serine/threonine protein kinase